MGTWYGRPKRPGGVAFLAILSWVIAFLTLLEGFVFLLADSQALVDTSVSVGTAHLYGWGDIAFGILTALVGVGLWVGSNLARLALSALMAVRIAASVWAAFALVGNGGFLLGALAGGLSLIVLLLLWNTRSDAFFVRV